jgi:hypothetical protein
MYLGHNIDLIRVNALRQYRSYQHLLHRVFVAFILYVLVRQSCQLTSSYVFLTFLTSLIACTLIDVVIRFSLRSTSLFPPFHRFFNIIFLIFRYSIHLSHRIHRCKNVRKERQVVVLSLLSTNFPIMFN